MGRQPDQVEGESVQPDNEAGPSTAVADEENDQFWGLDDIPGTYPMKFIWLNHQTRTMTQGFFYHRD